MGVPLKRYPKSHIVVDIALAQGLAAGDNIASEDITKTEDLTFGDDFPRSAGDDFTPDSKTSTQTMPTDFVS